MRDRRLYSCFVRGWNTRDSARTTYVIAGDLSRDLTDPDAWRISNGVEDPGVPPSMSVGNEKFAGRKTNWLEGNVVDVKGKLRVCWRYHIDLFSTVGISAICDFEDDGVKLNYKFTQFYPIPGAQNHFHIIHDSVSGLFWMTSNPIRYSQDSHIDAQLKQNPRYSGTTGNERRSLALFCSFDSLNWLPAGYVILWPLVRQASNYCGLLIDDNDLLIVARTSRNGRDQHDNDLTTFHRIRNFRDRAAFLLPREE